MTTTKTTAKQTATNVGAVIIAMILERWRPQPREAPRYISPAQAFSDLRRFAYLTRAQMAAKLGLSEVALQKIEGGMVGGNPQLDTIERAMEIASDYHLPNIITFLTIYHSHIRTKPRRGPKPASRSDKWYDIAREGVS